MSDNFDWVLQSIGVLSVQCPNHPDRHSGHYHWKPRESQSAGRQVEVDNRSLDRRRGDQDLGLCPVSLGPGGGDYGPQSRGPSGSYFDRPALTEQQAHDVVENAVKKWNPDLEVGKIKDGGSFFEAEILTEEKEVFGRLAVDKQSGQIRVIY